MTHTTQVLSDEQIEEIRTEVFKRWQAMVDRGQIPGDDYCDHELSRAIESATLKAVSGQEPVAWRPLQTSAKGREAVQAFFNDKLKRRDFDRYIMGKLAPDFACALGGYLAANALPPAQPAPVDEREAFEAWARERGYQRDELDRCRIGIVGPEYFNPNTEMAWQSWQARAALQCAQAPQPTKGGA